MNKLKRLGLVAMASCMIMGSIPASATEALTFTNTEGMLEGDMASYNVTVTNNTGETANPIMVLVWSEDGETKLVGYDRIDDEGGLAPGNSEVLSAYISGVSETANSVIKGFIWNDNQYCAPVYMRSDIHKSGEVTGLRVGDVDADITEDTITLTFPLWNDDGTEVDTKTTLITLDGMETATINGTTLQSDVETEFDWVACGAGHQLIVGNKKYNVVVKRDFEINFDDKNIVADYEATNGTGDDVDIYAITNEAARKYITVKMTSDTAKIGVDSVSNAMHVTGEPLGNTRGFASGNAMYLENTNSGSDAAFRIGNLPGLSDAEDFSFEYAAVYDYQNLPANLARYGPQHNQYRFNNSTNFALHTTGFFQTGDAGTADADNGKRPLQSKAETQYRITMPRVQSGTTTQGNSTLGSYKHHWVYVNLSATQENKANASIKMWGVNNNGANQTNNWNVNLTDSNAGWLSSFDMYMNGTNAVRMWIDNIKLSYTLAKVPDSEGETDSDATSAPLNFEGNISKDGIVMVEGSGNPGLVSVEIVKNYNADSRAGERDTILVDAFETDENGMFNITMKMPESEKPSEDATTPNLYTLVVGNTNNMTPESERIQQLSFSTYDMENYALGEVNDAATANDMILALESYGDILQIGDYLKDTVYEENSPEIAQSVIKARENQTDGEFVLVDTVREAFVSAIGKVAMMQAADVDEFAKAVGKYKGILGLDTAAFDASYELQSAMLACRDSVFAECDMQGNEAIGDIFKQIEAVGAVNIATRGDVIGVIESYKTIFERDTTSLGEHKDTVAGKICVVSPEKAYGTVKEIQDAYDDAKKNAEKKEESNTGGIVSGKKPNKNKGSSGSSGGSSPTILVPKNEGVVVAPEATKTFKDLQSVPWAEEYINTLAFAGIVNGKTEDDFAPNDYVTREEFTKMLALTLKLDAQNAKATEFTDVVADAWYVPYVNAVNEAGLIKGYEDGSFGIGTNIRREEVAVMIARAVAYKEISLNATEVNFADKSEISEFAIDSVAICVGAGIIQGNDQNQFCPGNSITRAECAKVICCLLNLL